MPGGLPAVQRREKHDGIPSSKMAITVMAIRALARKRTQRPPTADESILDGPRQIIQRRLYPAVPQQTCGFVAGVQNVKNPVSSARAVMDRAPRGMLIGKGCGGIRTEPAGGCHSRVQTGRVLLDRGEVGPARQGT